LVQHKFNILWSLAVAGLVLVRHRVVVQVDSVQPQDLQLLLEQPMP
jgi:hypothetical protein